MSEVGEERYQPYMDAIRRRVCAVCLDRRDDGSCRLDGGRMCAIEAHVPLVVETILTVRSDRMDDYVDAIKSRICGRCRCQDLAEHCAFRHRGECALWTYLPFVVDAVEEASLALGRSPTPPVA
jgi:hypothetical protein